MNKDPQDQPRPHPPAAVRDCLTISFTFKFDAGGHIESILTLRFYRRIVFSPINPGGCCLLGDFGGGRHGGVLFMGFNNETGNCTKEDVGVGPSLCVGVKKGLSL